MKAHIVDKVGIFLSVICGVHCILTPVVLILSPWLAEYWSNEYFHIIWLAAASLVILSVMLRKGTSSSIVKLGLAGLLCLALGLSSHLFEGGHSQHEEHFNLLEIIPTFLGGVLLVIAHLKNIRDCSCQSKKEATALL